MGLFSLFRRGAVAAPPGAAEARYGDAGGFGGFLPGGFGAFGGGEYFGGGGHIAPHLAQNISAVVACVNAIAGPISSVPAIVFRAIDNGREEAPNHHVSRLIRRPNDRQTWPDWLAFTLGQTLLHGNSVSVIERDGAGRPVKLLPIPWYAVSVQLLASGRLAFDITMPLFLFGGGPGQANENRRYFEDEIFWLRDRSDDGYLGKSVLARAPAVLRAALGIQQYTASLWGNAVIPSGILATDGKLGAEVREQLVSDWARYKGAENAGRTIVLEQGLEWKPTAMTPEDSEVLASRRFTIEEIARLFSVPPPIIGDFQFGSFTNAETAGRWHSSLCLSIWCRRIEAEFSRSVFADDNSFHLMIDLSGLQRGDDAARWATYAVAIDKGILTVDEVRALEGFNPLQKATAEVAPGDEVKT